MDDKLLTLKDVSDATTLGKTSIYKLMAKGEFPKCRKVGEKSVWSQKEVNTWINRLFEREAA